MLIDGAWVEAGGGDWIESENPFTGKPWAMIARGGPGDVEKAVQAAYAAFKGPWRGMTASARGAVLRKFGDLVAANADRLGELETRDNGKLITEMRGQMRYIPQWFYYFAGLADKVEGRVIPIDKPGVFNFTREEPLGVIAAITPWNSPLMLATWKLAPALAAGNTVVWKPSEFSSVSAFAFGELFEQAGFPPGVVNIVTGYGSELGEALVTHPRVAKVAFTGGDATGQHVYELAARGIKPVTLELGGKSANIVFEDADLDNAVKGAVSGIFAATGQTCIAGSRLLVQRSVHDAFMEKLLALASTARMGDPLEESTQVGPITTQPQYKKVLSYIKIAKGEGASCVLGGQAVEGVVGDGHGLVVGIEGDHRQHRAEHLLLGDAHLRRHAGEDRGFHEPAVAALWPGGGLAAGVWTSSIKRALRMSERLEAGTVWVNTYRAVSYMSPFGGYKRSGIGRESGLTAIHEYLQTKSVWIDTNDEVPNPFVMR